MLMRGWRQLTNHRLLNYQITLNPGYSIQYLRDNDHRAAAQRVMRRMFLRNPLHKPEIWPREIQFDTLVGGNWHSTTFAQLSNHVNFPQLRGDQVNQCAVDLVGGTYALHNASALGTYMGMLTIKEQGLDLTRKQTEEYLRGFPGKFILLIQSVLLKSEKGPK